MSFEPSAPLTDAQKIERIALYQGWGAALVGRLHSHWSGLGLSDAQKLAFTNEIARYENFSDLCGGDINLDPIVADAFGFVSSHALHAYRAAEMACEATWPVQEFDEIYHLGTMDPTSKDATHNRHGQEGNGLSVSTEPDAWRRIAKLGGNPLWTISSPGAKLTFLDRHALKDEHWKWVELWAQKEGLVVPSTFAVVSWDEEEYEGADNCVRMSMVFDSAIKSELGQAYQEMKDHKEDGSNPLMATEPRMKATAKLNDRIGYPVHQTLARDLALTCFVEDVLHRTHNLQGTWWSDDLNVFAYSAPRGVIHLQALPELKACCLQKERSQNYLESGSEPIPAEFAEQTDSGADRAQSPPVRCNP